MKEEIRACDKVVLPLSLNSRKGVRGWKTRKSLLEISVDVLCVDVYVFAS